MGLDIYGHLLRKTRERKEGESLEHYYTELRETADKEWKQELDETIKNGIEKIKALKKEPTKTDFNRFMYSVKKFFNYEFQTEALENAAKVEDIEEWAKHITYYYKPHDLYFRKVNAVYRYFQDRLEDEAVEITRDDAVDIINKATTVLAERDESVSADILPTQGGFFFGSTDYDEYYYDCAREIVDEFSKLLLNWKNDETCFIIMSW